jgi:hypothetical protein
MSGPGRKRKRKRLGIGSQPGHITVYRGTSLGGELRLLAETDGYVLSDAARDGYYTYVHDGYAFDEAWPAGLNRSEAALQDALRCWGGPDVYARAHAEFGSELSRVFGPRPLISWTTSLATARHFAGPNGYVLTARVKIADIVNADWSSNDESEVLMANGVWAEVSSMRPR